MEKQELRLAQDYADENAVALEDVIEKIRAGELKGKIDDGVWYVVDETTKSQVSESAKDAVSDLNSDAAFFVKLSNGYYGLAKTFWLFGFVLATLLALLPFAIGIFLLLWMPPPSHGFLTPASRAATNVENEVQYLKKLDFRSGF